MSQQEEYEKIMNSYYQLCTQFRNLLLKEGYIDLEKILELAEEKSTKQLSEIASFDLTRMDYTSWALENIGK